MFFTLVMIIIVVGNQSLQACHFHSPIDGGASETGELLELVCGCTGLRQGTSSLVLLDRLPFGNYNNILSHVSLTDLPNKLR